MARNGLPKKALSFIIALSMLFSMVTVFAEGDLVAEDDQISETTTIENFVKIEETTATEQSESLAGEDDENILEVGVGPVLVSHDADVLTLSQSESVVFQSGDGGVDNPFIISTAEQLSLINNYLGDLGLGVYFKLGADIELNALSNCGAPFGDQSMPFQGSFDSDKYTIKNLTLSTTTAQYIGLFGYVGTDGRVKNVKLEGVNISGGNYVGALAGYNRGVISTSYATGTITTVSNSYAGGVVGYNSEGSISNCYAVVSLLSPNGASRVGGFLGRMDGGDISNCYSASTISGTGSYTKGGFVGQLSYGTISNCYYDGQLYGEKGYYSKLTSELTDGTLPTGFASANWTVESGLYPRLAFFNDASPLSKASVAASVLPLRLARYDWLKNVKFDVEAPLISAYNASVSWSSDDSGILSISGDMGTLIKNGDTKLTASITYSGITIDKVFFVTVNKLDIAGTGTTSNPYRIDTAKKLDGIKYFVIAPNYDTSANFLLTANINLANWEGENYKGWKAIGDSSYPFNFSFDGGQFLISNLTGTNTTDTYVSLFGYVGTDGRVKNVKLEGVNISGGNYVGALAGYNRGVISTSYATGTITTVSNSYAGGVVGYNSEGSISNCYAVVSLLSPNGASRVGGFLGRMDGGDISNCYSASTISGTGSYTKGGFVGQLSYGTISNCYYDGQLYGEKDYYSKLTSELTDGTLPTGFASANWGATSGLYPRLRAFDGYNDAVKLSVAASILPVNMFKYDYLGDVKFNWTLPSTSLFGTTVTWSSSSKNYLTISNYEATIIDNGNIAITAKVSMGESFIQKAYNIKTTYCGFEGDGSEGNPILINSAEQLNLIRNLVKAPSNAVDCFIRLNSNIDLEFWEGENYKGWKAIGDSNYPFNFSFDGGQFLISNLTGTNTTDTYVSLFGYVGTNGRIKNVKLEGVNISGGNYVGTLAGYNRGVISTSYATGTITTVSNSYAGGLVGYNSEGSISNCYAVVSLLSPNGASRVGGFLGRMDGGDISNCYSASTISGTGSYTKGGFVGQLSYGTISNCYYDGQVSGTSDSNNATPLTTAQMKDLGTYTSWDVSDIWARDTGINNGYPYLRYSAPINVSVSSVLLSNSALALTVGSGSAQLYATILPSNATNKSITWTSGNSNIASVSQNGLVSPVGAGSTTITATTVDGGKTAICDVIVLGGTTQDKITNVTANPSSGIVASGTTVELGCVTDGVTIRYTLDGSEPTVSSIVYTTPIEITAATTIKAKAFKDGMVDSDISTFIYSIPAQEKVSNVTANPLSGAVTSGSSVTLSCATSGAIIRYTTDGSEPTELSAQYASPIVITEATTIKAKAFKVGLTDGETSTFTYTIVTEDTPMVTVGTVSGRPSETVDVPVTISNNPGISLYEFSLEFDNTKLTPVSITPGTDLEYEMLLDLWIPAVNLTSNIQSGMNLEELEDVTALWTNTQAGVSGTSDIAMDGLLFTVKFEIKEDAEETTVPLTLVVRDVSKQNLQKVDLAVAHGGVNIYHIPPYTPGDVTGDSAVSGMDVLFLAQYVAGWYPVWSSQALPGTVFDDITEEQFRLAADVYLDDSISGIDVLLLAQYVASWPVVIPTTPSQ